MHIKFRRLFFSFILTFNSSRAVETGTKPYYFLPDSFQTGDYYWGDTRALPTLSCFEKIEIELQKVKPFGQDPDPKPKLDPSSNRTLYEEDLDKYNPGIFKGKAVADFLMSNCGEFKHPIWKLKKMKGRKKAKWERFDPTFTLRVEKKQSCEVQLVYDLSFGVESDALLLASSSAGFQKKDIPFWKLPVTFKKTPLKSPWFISFESSKTMRNFTGEGEKETEVIGTVQLGVTNKKREYINIVDDTGVGNYSFSNAEILSVLLLDADSDNYPEVIVETGHNGALLLNVRGQDVHVIQRLKPVLYTGIGGC